MFSFVDLNYSKYFNSIVLSGLYQNKLSMPNLGHNKYFAIRHLDLESFLRAFVIARLSHSMHQRGEVGACPARLSVHSTLRASLVTSQNYDPNIMQIVLKFRHNCKFEL